MTRKYQAMIVLDTKSKEETVEQLVQTITHDMEKSGLKLDQVNNLGKKNFPFSPRHVTAGHFIQYFFSADNQGLTSIRGKLKLNDNVYQQFYLKA
jgi:small subunit ribosomal protein S6